MSRFGLGFVSALGGVPGNDSFTKILLNMSSSVTADTAIGAASFPRSWTNGGASLSATGDAFVNMMQGPYVTTAPTTDLKFDASAFTIDFRVNLNGQSGGFYLFGDGSSTGTNPTVNSLTNTSGIVTITPLFSASPGPTQSFPLSSTTNFYTSGTHHVAYVRESASVAKFYVDGVMQSSRSDLTGASLTNVNNFSVGRNGDFPTFPMPSTAKIGNFRFSNGVARWVANFTPPTAPYI